MAINIHHIESLWHIHFLTISLDAISIQIKEHKFNNSKRAGSTENVERIEQKRRKLSYTFSENYLFSLKGFRVFWNLFQLCKILHHFIPHSVFIVNVWFLWERECVCGYSTLRIKIRYEIKAVLHKCIHKSGK